MPYVLMVYVPQESLSNRDYGLSRGRWAFPSGVVSPDLQHLEVGDLIFFGAGGYPRKGGKLSGWRSRTLREAHIARVASLPYHEPTLFWPDEIIEGAAKYDPTIDIEYVKRLSSVPLAPGVALSASASDALYRGGVSNQVNRVSTSGSRALSGLKPRLSSRSARAAASVSGTATATTPTVRLVAVESQRSRKALVKARPTTVAHPVESGLVHEYVNHLEAAGDEVGALLVELPCGRSIRNDLINRTSRVLVEAKQASTREHIRTAIGQILDYQRFWKAHHRAVLVPDRPDMDLLRLLDSTGIKAIWRDGNGGFEDNANGVLV
jgi:hypothetical protein